MKIGAGERPSRLKGALAVANPKPQRFRLLKPKLMQNDGRGRQDDAGHVDLHLRASLIGLQPETQEEDKRGDRDEQPERRPPADKGAENAADQECQNAGAGARGTQRAQRGGLLTSFVVLRDQRDQRRHDHGARGAAERLRGDHQIRRRAERHQDLRRAEHENGHAENPKRPVTLGELRAEHHKAGDEHRVSHDAGGDGGRGNPEALDHPAKRDRQGGDIEGHDRLTKRDRDHRHPGLRLLLG